MLLLCVFLVALATLVAADIAKVKAISADKSIEGYLKPVLGSGNTMYLSVDKNGAKFCHSQDELSDPEFCSHAKIGYSDQFLSYGANTEKAKFFFDKDNNLVSENHSYLCKHLDIENPEKEEYGYSENLNNLPLVVKGKFAPGEFCVEIDLILETISETVQLSAVTKTEKPVLKMVLRSVSGENGLSFLAETTHSNTHVNPHLSFTLENKVLTQRKKLPNGEFVEYKMGIFEDKLALGPSLEAKDFNFDRNGIFVSDNSVYLCAGEDSPGSIVLGNKITGEKCKEVYIEKENVSQNTIYW